MFKKLFGTRNTTEVTATTAVVQAVEADPPQNPYFDYGKRAGANGEFAGQGGEVNIDALAFDAAIAGFNEGQVPLPEFALAALREGYEEGAAAGRSE